MLMEVWCFMTVNYDRESPFGSVWSSPPRNARTWLVSAGPCQMTWRCVAGKVHPDLTFFSSLHRAVSFCWSPLRCSSSLRSKHSLIEMNKDGCIFFTHKETLNLASHRNLPGMFWFWRGFLKFYPCEDTWHTHSLTYDTAWRMKCSSFNLCAKSFLMAGYKVIPKPCFTCESTLL